MNALIKNVLIGAATVAIAAAPLAASAQQWHNGQNDHRGQWHGNVHYNNGYHHPYKNNRWHEGYYGVAPGGFHGYYHNGGWYHHRRFQSGIWLYF
jgi:hypothetical protein